LSQENFLFGDRVGFKNLFLDFSVGVFWVEFMGKFRFCELNVILVLEYGFDIRCFGHDPAFLRLQCGIGFPGLLNFSVLTHHLIMG
jgi:hypothetical protein